MEKVYALILTYDINFRDADDGDSYAGSSKELVSIHSDKDALTKVLEEYNPIFSKAEKETTIFPLGEANKMLKSKFGFTVFDFDDGYNFRLYVKEFDVKVWS
jgi:hypothetical protein